MLEWTYVKGKFTIRFATDYCFDKDDEVDADCFFTDESTSFAFFLPVDKAYMI